MYAGRRGRRPLPCTAPRNAHAPRRATPTPRAMQRPRPAPCNAHAPRHATPMPRTMSAPPRHARTHGRARRPRRAAPTRTPTGTPTGTRAAGDVGPYHHAPRHATPTPRATSAPPRRVRIHGRARRPRRAAPTGTPSGTPTGTRAASTGTPSGTPTCTRAAGDVGPLLDAPAVAHDDLARKSGRAALSAG